jgi:hypothetical protein
LQRYVNEFAFRWNHRVALGVNDAQRAHAAIKGIEGKRLTYRRDSRMARIKVLEKSPKRERGFDSRISFA